MEDAHFESTCRSVDVPVVIRFGDTDPYGVVYCASYFRYCHRGIEEFFRHIGIPPQELFRNREEGFGLPIVGASCDFHKPVWYGETLNLRVSIIKCGTRALTFGFNFFRTTGAELVARGQATVVAIDSHWQSRSLPERLLRGIAPFLPVAETVPSA
jgi:acyl-CoA thioester hydrolase